MAGEKAGNPLMYTIYDETGTPISLIKFDTLDEAEAFFVEQDVEKSRRWLINELDVALDEIEAYRKAKYAPKHVKKKTPHQRAVERRRKRRNGGHK